MDIEILIVCVNDTVNNTAIATGTSDLERSHGHRLDVIEGATSACEKRDVCGAGEGIRTLETLR